MRLLLVEDNFAYKNILTEIISVRFPDLTLKLAATVADAKKLIDKFDFDVIFSDIRLPDASGFDALRYAKRQNSHTIVVMLTSFDLDEYREFARQIGADYFINKDTPIDDVLKFLADLLATLSHSTFDRLSDNFSLSFPITENIENLRITKARSA